MSLSILDQITKNNRMIEANSKRLEVNQVFLDKISEQLKVNSETVSRIDELVRQLVKNSNDRVEDDSPAMKDSNKRI